MPIEQTFEKKEDAPEWLHSSLAEENGKFVFRGETSTEVENLKKTTKTERDRRVKLEADAKKYDPFKEILDAEQEERDAFLEGWKNRGQQKDDKTKNDPDAKQQLEMKDKLHAKEVKKLTDENGTLKADLQKAQTGLREFQLWTPLREIAIKNGLNPEDWELARLELSHQSRFGFDEDGKIVVIEDGHPSTVTPEKFFKDVYSDLRPKFYKATNAGGSGAQHGTKGTGNGKKTMTREAFEALDQAGRMKTAKEGVQIVD